MSILEDTEINIGDVPIDFFEQGGVDPEEMEVVHEVEKVSVASQLNVTDGKSKER